MQVPRSQVPKPPANPIADHCLADRSAHDESHLGRLIGVHPNPQMTCKERPTVAAAATHSGLELSAPAHARSCGQHRTPPSPGRRSGGQTLTRARPLRRRDASTARPARVRMRSLKPCVFARRRLFGWNVRLLTETPDAGQDLRRWPSGVATTSWQPTPVLIRHSTRTRLAWTPPPFLGSVTALVACKARPPHGTLTSPFRQTAQVVLRTS